MKECGDNPYKDNTMEVTLEMPHDNVQQELTYYVQQACQTRVPLGMSYNNYVLGTILNLNLFYSFNLYNSPVK